MFGTAREASLIHWALMPANLTTLAHFSVSSAINLAKSAGDPPGDVPPRSITTRCLNLGSAIAALISFVEQRDDLGGRVLRRAQAAPAAHLREGRQGIRQWRNVRQAIQTPPRRHKASARTVLALAYSSDDPLVANTTRT